MEKVKSILDFGGGEIIDRINYEFAKVVDNINNPNTDEKARKITVEVQLVPINNRKTVSMTTVVKTKLSPINSVHTQMVLQQDNQKIVGYEADGLGEGQIDIFGEVHEVKYIELSNDDKEAKE